MGLYDPTQAFFEEVCRPVAEEVMTVLGSKRQKVIESQGNRAKTSRVSAAVY
jgi:hypothetical protein